MNKLTRVFSDETAKGELKQWGRDHKAQITHYFSCSYWEYDTPFWGLVVRLFSWESHLNGVYGFHVYEDGEVKLIGRMEGYGESGG